MSIVDKIPPLVSALAFGYGVGMAAPEGTLSHVQGAMTSPRAQTQQVRPSAPPLDMSLEQRLPGRESTALAELRANRSPSRYGGASSMDAAPYSRAPRNFSSVLADGEGVDESDLFDPAETAALSRLRLPDLGLSISRQTLKYVRYFTRTDRGRDLFATWLKRSGRYQEMISEELRARGLPEDLIWVAMIESGFDATARSPVGATGLWQFMPATGAVYGLRQNRYVDQRRNPRLATQAAAHHLRDLYQRFGQWDLALAAYNMGYEQVLDRVDQVGSTDFDELVRHGVLPEETSKYVPKIIAAAIVASNLERFDFDDVQVSRPISSGEISVPPKTPLSLIAKAAGVSTATIRKLNPDVLGKELPPGKGDYMVQVPPEAVSQALAALPTMIRRQQTDLDVEDVLDPFDLMNPQGYRPLNPEDDRSLLTLLPKPKKKKRTMRDPLLEGIDKPSTVDDDDDEPVAEARESVLYRVGAGDTVSTIAKQFALKPEDVARQNKIKVSDDLKEGGLLRIRVDRKAASQDKDDLVERRSNKKAERDDEPEGKQKRGSRGS